MANKKTLRESVEHYIKWYSGDHPSSGYYKDNPVELCHKVLSRFIDYNKNVYRLLLNECLKGQNCYTVRISISIQEQGWTKWHESMEVEFPLSFQPKWITAEVIKGIEEIAGELNAEIQAGLDES